MHTVEQQITEARSRLILTGRHAPGDRSTLYRRRQVGELVRVAPGALAAADWWVGLYPEQRQRTRAVALAIGRPETIWGHRTAAAIWGLPLFRGEPDRPEAVLPLHPGGRSDASVRLHRTTMPFEVIDIDGLRVTSLERTLLDVARVRPRIEAVPMLDRALRHARRDESGIAAARADRPRMLDELRAGTDWGRSRARRSIDFADGDSGSELESGTRVVVDDLGFERPRLQIEFRDERGFAGRVDFAWKNGRIVGEADGRSKYLDPELRGDRTLEQVLLDEKQREDRIRPLCDRFFRFGAADLRDSRAFARRLVTYGVPLRR